jgi:predicted dehydrogenase
MIEYEGGVRGVVDVRWHSHVPRDEFRVRGTEGEIDLSPLNGPQILHPGGVEQLAAAANLHYPCIEDFVSAILRDILPRSYGEGALAAEWVMEQVTP